MGNGLSRKIQTRLFGRHMVYPILAATAVGRAEGISIDRITHALASLAPTPGRMESVQLDNNATILKDDYKSSLETIYCAIETLWDIPVKQRIVVLGQVEDAPGSLGPIHRNIGRMLARHASKVILICVSKAFKEIRSGARSAGMSEDAVVHAGRYWPDALKILEQDLAGNFVLIKGRRTQRLDRILLALKGKRVGCHIPECKSNVKTCERCAMLEKGWEGLRITV